MGVRSFKAGIRIKNACRTPEAVYFTGLDVSTIRLEIELPVNMISTVSDEEAKLIAELHKAILPVIEKLYRERWNLLAGKKIGTDSNPMPATWEELCNKQL